MDVRTFLRVVPMEVIRMIVSLLVITLSLLHTPRNLSTEQKTIASPDSIEQKTREDDTGIVKPTFKESENYNLTMSLRRPNFHKWLIVDGKYEIEHNIRRQLLQNNKRRVMKCLPGSETACQEVLDLALHFLISSYPDRFERITSAEGVDQIYVKGTNEIYEIPNKTAGSSQTQALELAASIAVEDFNIVMEDDNGLHIL